MNVNIDMRNKAAIVFGVVMFLVAMTGIISDAPNNAAGVTLTVLAYAGPALAYAGFMKKF